MNSHTMQQLEKIIKKKDKECQRLTDLLKEKTMTIQKLEEAQDWSEGILAHVPGHVYWLNRDNIYLGCNDLHAKTADLDSRQQIVGKTNFDMPWAKEADAINALNNLVMSTNTSQSKEEQATIHGVWHTFISQKVPLKNKENKVIGLLGISIDITEQKLLQQSLKEAKEKAEVANKAKSEFIANMSHDIRTPLTGILGLTQEMIDVADNAHLSLLQPSHSKENDNLLLSHMVETVQEDGQYLLNAADELLQLLSEILETMRLDSGKVSEKPESFNLHELIEHNIELMQPVARHKKLTLSSEIKTSIPLYFRGLRNYLDRTILNLLSNALKFTDQGFVKINVQLLGSSTSHPGQTAELQITVEDSGAGIPKDKFETIFEHFSRLTSSYQGIYKGAGLGLYTVKRYIEAMKATINVESEVGKGTRFIINLPLIVSDHSDREKQSYRMPKKPSNVQQPKTSKKPENITKAKAKAFVLIVEDNRAAAIAIKACLKHADCAADLAENGMMALKMVQENVYDLILMDIGLPDIEGIEVTRQIRALNSPYTSKVPIIAVTGHADDPTKKAEALAAGMQAVFSKPLPLPTLEALLKQFVFHRNEDHEAVAEQMLKASANDSEIIDWEASVNIMNGDEDCVRELISMFSDDLKLSKETIAKAYASHDNETLRKELHRVRGGVAYLKLPQLDKALAQFHESVKESPQNPEQLNARYSHLQDAMKAFWNVWEKKAF